VTPAQESIYTLLLRPRLQLELMAALTPQTEPKVAEYAGGKLFQSTSALSCQPVSSKLSAKELYTVTNPILPPLRPLRPLRPR
jgi:hypothetical protein